MAKNRGWWELVLTGNTLDELSDCDREHIAKCITDGCGGGDIVQDDLEEQLTCECGWKGYADDLKTAMQEDEFKCLQEVKVCPDCRKP